MKRLGLDYGSIKLINPKIIYVSITGYGQEGPKSNFAGHDLNYIGDTGLLSLSMGKDCLLYTSPSPRDRTRARMPSSA